MAKLFVGYGGRAGTICFCSANVTLAFFIVLGALGLAQFNINSYFRALMLSDLDPVRMLTTVAAGVFGIIATVLLREKLLQKCKAPSEVVLGSATVALVSGLVLPWVVPSLALKVAAVVASGTYAGMVPRKVVAVDVHLVLAGGVVECPYVNGLHRCWWQAWFHGSPRN